jgi:hypothetical protein
VCKLDVGEFKESVDHLFEAAESVHGVAAKMVGEARSLLENSQVIATSVREGILFGGRSIWYSGLREAQKYVRHGRLADFNHLLFEAPCRQDIEFQWGICRMIGEIAMDPQWDITTRHRAVSLHAELYKDRIWITNKELDTWILQLIYQVTTLNDSIIANQAKLALQGQRRKEILLSSFYIATLSVIL